MQLTLGKHSGLYICLAIAPAAVLASSQASAFNGSTELKAAVACSINEAAVAFLHFASPVTIVFIAGALIAEVVAAISNPKSALAQNVIVRNYLPWLMLPWNFSTWLLFSYNYNLLYTRVSDINYAAKVGLPLTLSSDLWRTCLEQNIFGAACCFGASLIFLSAIVVLAELLKLSRWLFSQLLKILHLR